MGLAFRVAALFAAWSWAAYFGSVLEWLGIRIPRDPSVPFLASPQPPDGVSDVRSSVGWFCVTLLALSVSVGLIEVVKLLHASRQRVRAAVITLGLISQVVLLWEFIRHHCEDWYLFFLSILGMVDLAIDPYYTPGTMIHIPFPFVTLVLLALTCVADIRTTVRDRPGS